MEAHKLDLTAMDKYESMHLVLGPKQYDNLIAVCTGERYVKRGHRRGTAMGGHCHSAIMSSMSVPHAFVLSSKAIWWRAATCLRWSPRASGP